MRKKYTREEKAAAVNRYKNGEPTCDIIANLGVKRSTFYGWLGDDGFSRDLAKRQFKVSPASEINLLRNKLKKADEMLCILQSVNCTTFAPPAEKCAALLELGASINVHAACAALKLNRATFLNYRNRGIHETAWFRQHYSEIEGRVIDAFNESKGAFGAQRIVLTLADQGIRTSEKYVLRIMRDHNLVSSRDSFTIARRRRMRREQNAIKGAFVTNAPNKVWCMDFSEYEIKGRKYHVCAVIDLFSRMAVGFQIGSSPCTRLAKQTVLSAIKARNPAPGLILHRDNGAAFTSRRFMEFLNAYGIVSSFSRPHVPQDNAVAEAFFKNLKNEEIYPTIYRSEHDFRTSLSNYVSYYNTRRPHAANGRKSPKQKEYHWNSKNMAS